jgi:hypothetical protein
MVHGQDPRQREERHAHARRVELLLVVPDDLPVGTDPGVWIPLAKRLLEAGSIAVPPKSELWSECG